MEALLKKLNRLEEQKARIEEEIIKLNQEKNESLINVFRMLPPSRIDPATLLGGLLFVLEEALKNPEVEERWRYAGQKFLRRTNRKDPGAVKAGKTGQNASATQQDPTAG